MLDGGTRAGIGNPAINGDGNWVEPVEGVDFSASLVSASSLVVPGTIYFRIARIGLRGFETDFSWESAGSSPFSTINTFETTQLLDTGTVSLEETDYSGRLQGNSNFQLSNNGVHAGQSLVLNARHFQLSPLPIPGRTPG